MKRIVQIALCMSLMLALAGAAAAQGCGGCTAACGDKTEASSANYRALVKPWPFGRDLLAQTAACAPADAHAAVAAVDRQLQEVIDVRPLCAVES